MLNNLTKYLVGVYKTKIACTCNTEESKLGKKGKKGSKKKVSKKLQYLE